MKSSYAVHAKLIAYFCLSVSTIIALALTIEEVSPLFLAGLYTVNTVTAVVLVMTELEERRFQR